MKKFALIAFAAFSAMEILSGFSGNELFHLISKPMIMISLGAYYVLAAGADRSNTVLAAILFSFAGDVFLLSADYFIPGLASFLIAHILYIFSYRQHRDDGTEHESPRGIHRIRLAFPVVLAGTGLVVILYPALGDLKVPVVVYAAAITLMVLNALFRYGRTSSDSFWLVFAGAVLFMLSDSILAINKFLTPVANSGVWIMLTYVVAQFLIIEGLVRHKFDGASKQF